MHDARTGAGDGGCERDILSDGREHQFLIIDLKSFYASVECVERGLDPMTAHLVVADPERTDKTICLAVSPALKELGVRNRCRVFEIPSSIRYEMATPRMALYIRKSAEIYGIYLRWFAKEDVYVYSIDEAWMDVTGYLDLYGCSARELGEKVREDVVRRTGIPATCGLGSNMYLAKVALDITAKHSPGFFGELDLESYRQTLWNHRPLTDFWRVGPGTERRLHALGISCMGQLALYPDTDKLYKVFGVDAEILIDHAWGIEPVTMADIASYKSKDRSLSSSQVLGCDAKPKTGLLLVREMADNLSLELLSRHLVASSVTVVVGWRPPKDHAWDAPGEDEMSDGRRGRWGELATSASWTLTVPTQSRERLEEAVSRAYEEAVEGVREVHRLTVCLNGVRADDAPGLQLDLLADHEADERELARERAVSTIKEKFGKNSLLRARDLLPDATARERNQQIGGHRGGL